MINHLPVTLMIIYLVVAVVGACLSLSVDTLVMAGVVLTVVIGVPLGVFCLVMSVRELSNGKIVVD